MNTIKNNLINHQRLLVPIAICAIAFLVKGTEYLLIGSFVPFGLGIIYLISVYYIFGHTNRLARRLIRISAVLLILWALSRLAVELLFAFTPVTEMHIREQFTVLGKLVSAGVLLFGFYSYRNAKNYKSTEISA